MSKSRIPPRWHEDEDEYYEDRSASREKRKQKRLQSALKTKNVDDLMRLEEDEEDF